MRIISDFKDYYDRHERSDPVYVRKTMELDSIQELRGFEHWIHGLRAETKWVQGSASISSGFLDVFPSMLAFCGKAFIWYECEKLGVRFDDHDSMIEFVGRERSRYWAKEQDESKAEWARLTLRNVADINHALSSPIVLIRKVQRARFSYGNTGVSSVSVTVNPRLKSLDFGRLVPADQCHQEIEMFVGGVLASNGKEAKPITDKEKLIAHGMDLRWSFRNPFPPTRKRK